MNKNTQFSVVIPLYNKEENIKNTIRSVLNQKYSDYEIIVVDDGSTDRSKEEVLSINSSKINLISQENGGVSIARNKGVECAKHEWIAFLDADDFWAEDFLENMNDLINDFPYCNLFGCSYYIQKNGKKQQIEFPLPQGFRGAIDKYFTLAVENTLFTSSSSIVNKNAFLSIGGFDTRISIGEDIDLWLRLNNIFRSCVINTPFVTYNHDGENRAMKKKYPFKKSYFYYMEKYNVLFKDNEDAIRYINYVKTRSLPSILYNYNIEKEELFCFERSISKKINAPFMFKVFKKLPFKLKKALSKIYYSNKCK